MAKWEFGWEVDAESFAESFNVYTREKALGGPWTLQGSTSGRKFTVEVADVLETFEAAVAHVTNGIEADEELWQVIEFTPGSLDDIELPPDIDDFSAAQVAESFDVRLRWSAVEDPHLDGYEIREGANWEIGIVRAYVDKSVTETTFGMMSTGATQFHIKAKSVQGQWSENSVSYGLTIQTPPDWMVESTQSFEPTFNGTKTNTEVVSSKLQITKAPAVAADWTDIANTYTWPPMFPHLGSGTYELAAIEATDGVSGIVANEIVLIGLTTVKNDPKTMAAKHWRGTVRPRFSDREESFAITPGTRSVYSRINADGTLRDGNDLKVEIDTTPDDPAGSPTWDGWREYIPGATYRYRGMRLRFTLTSYWWSVVQVSALQVIRLRRNLKDEDRIAVGSTGGTAVTFVQPFTKIPVVTPTLIRDTGKEGWYAQAGNITKTGCDVYVYNASGTEQSSGVVGWTAKGV